MKRNSASHASRFDAGMSDWTPVRTVGLLQRKCACGGKPSGVLDQCDECSQKSLKIQRSADRSPEPSGVPPVVNEVLGSSGQPLDGGTRAFMESRFGHNFGHVRVHADAQATESARAVGALAYTVGRDIVFETGQYKSATESGKRLLAHELAHVVQQEREPARSGAGLEVGAADSPLEREADRAANAVSHDPMPELEPRAAKISGGKHSLNGKFQQMAMSDGIRPALNRSTHAISPLSRAGAHVLQRADKLPPLPGYSQKGDTCGAASLVSALMIWDRQRSDPTGPNSIVETACNIILTYLIQYRTKTIEGWNNKKLDGQALYDAAVSDVTTIRDNARSGGGKIVESDYQTLGLALYLLYVDEKQGGLSAAAISNLQAKLGLSTGQSAPTESFEGIFNSSILQNLQPGQIAQVGWYVKTTKPDAQGDVKLGHHAFLVGRLQDGKWFLSDQGPSPAFELQAADLGSLKTMIAAASSSGSYWIYTGAIADLKTFIVGGWTGVKLLGQPGGVQTKAAEIVKSGTFLAEVDAGWTTTGDKLYAGDFVSYHASKSEARLVNTDAYGGLIVEMPQGVFNYYRTNLVSDANLDANEIDKSDSEGGLLATKKFYHAWLRLCSANGCKSDFIEVY